MFLNQTVTVYENATTDEAVGPPLVAVQLGSDVSVTFSILSGNEDSVFKIGFCNGQLRILSPTLDYYVKNMYVLSVRAASNGLVESSTVANITIHVLNVPHVPVFNSTTCVVSVPEAGAVGLIMPPAVVAVDIDGREVSYSVNPLSVGATRVTIGNTTGEFSVDTCFAG